MSQRIPRRVDAAGDERSAAAAFQTMQGVQEVQDLEQELKEKQEAFIRRERVYRRPSRNLWALLRRWTAGGALVATP